MADWLLGLILTEPRLFRSIGRGLAIVGAGMILIGWRGHKFMALLDRRLARIGLEAPGSLAEMYPTLGARGGRREAGAQAADSEGSEMPRPAARGPITPCSGTPSGLLCIRRLFCPCSARRRPS